MGKLLLFVAAVIAVYVVLKTMARIAAMRRKDAELRDRARALRQAETMIACSFCGMNVPGSEAIPGGQRYFCSEEHRQRFGNRAAD